ncbi:MAG TPA: hypothetical protein VF263_00110 [Longimicrobiaceae bacterium]
MRDPSPSAPLRLLVWLFLLSLFAGQAAALAEEARGESKSPTAVVRVHGARHHGGRPCVDPPADAMLPDAGFEPAAGESCAAEAAPPARSAHLPARAAPRAEYPRGPPA